MLRVQTDVSWAVISGDMLASRSKDQAFWMPILKEALRIAADEDWDIYRGDGFQVLTSPVLAFHHMLLIRAYLRAHVDMDARIGIGIGPIEHRVDSLSESNGTAFIYAGEALDQLKNQHVAIQSKYPELDTILDVVFLLCDRIIHSWSPTSARMIYHKLLAPDKTQAQLANETGVSQSSWSQGLARAGYNELKKSDTLYRKLIMSHASD